jgi:hypothetical protein
MGDMQATALGRALASTLICITLGCGHRARVRNAGYGEPADVVLTVTNHHFLDVTVYLELDGQRSRVGTVTAVSTVQFHLRGNNLSASRQFRLFATAIGSNENVRTETLTIQSGQSIEWTLEHDLQRSSVGVY